jgi:hypothetical protein
VALASIAGAGYLALTGVDPDGPVVDADYFYLSPARPRDGRLIPASRLGSSDYCGHCHTEIFHQWNASAHHFSSLNNPYYRKVVLSTVERRGQQVMKFCAGCHDPLPLLSGEIDKPETNRWSNNAGITCVVCHRITEIHGGNGGYVVSPPVLHPLALADHPALQALHGALLRATPSLHRAALSKPFYRTAEYCAACHSLTTPKEINGMKNTVLLDEYTHWERSRFARDGSGEGGNGAASCNDCHMPRVPSHDPAAKNGLIRSHRFVGGNTALPALNRDRDQLRASEDFLRDRRVLLRCAGLRRNGALSAQGCEKFSAAAGDTIDLQFEVINHMVGHAFPAGTVDSNESWVELDVRDSDGRRVFHRGFTTATGEVDSAAHFFRATFVDRNGRATDRRTSTTEAVSMTSNTVIPTEGAVPVNYRFTIPSNSRLPLLATARVNWRKFDQRLTRWVFAGKDVPHLPITTLDEVTFAIRARTGAENSVAIRAVSDPLTKSSINNKRR